MGAFPVERELQLGEGPLLTMLHVSDLHFVGDLTERGRRLWVKRFVKSHAFAKIDALAQNVSDFRRKGRQIDVTIVTGDISTDGSNDSLRTALNFIEESEIRRDGRLITTGLAAVAETRLVIPGNHDRYSLLPFQAGSKNLEEVFQTPRNYPYAVGFPTKGSVTEASVVFFAFDSTLPDWVGTPIISRIAQGVLFEAECAWLVDKANEIARTSVVKSHRGAQLKCNERTPRVVVLHHHPIQVRAKDSTLTRLRNGERFVDACARAKVNLVLFGHEHVEYYESKTQRGHTVHYMCCPSTSEYSSDPSGFYVVDLYEHGYRISRYHWLKKTGIFGHVGTHAMTWTAGMAREAREGS
jgi:3',5'-cyclic AMP phosphodiesterase CpdA